MSMRTILVPVEPHDLIISVLETARLLALRFEARVEGFAARAMLTGFAVGDIAILTKPELDSFLAKGFKVVHNWQEGKQQMLRGWNGGIEDAHEMEDLANGLGNLASRTLNMIQQYRSGTIPGSEGTETIAQLANQAATATIDAYEKFDFSHADR